MCAQLDTDNQLETTTQRSTLVSDVSMCRGESLSAAPLRRSMSDWGLLRPVGDDGQGQNDLVRFLESLARRSAS